jgi:hypothetical protein
LCDYLRILTLGASNPHEIEAVMEAELDLHHHDDTAISGAALGMGDAMPALGSSPPFWVLSSPWARLPSRRRFSVV